MGTSFSYSHLYPAFRLQPLALRRHKHTGIVHIIPGSSCLCHSHSLFAELLLRCHKHLAALVDLFVGAVRLQNMSLHIISQLHLEDMDHLLL